VLVLADQHPSYVGGEACESIRGTTRLVSSLLTWRQKHFKSLSRQACASLTKQACVAVSSFC
jgi:hypothetical protein